jgi:hypothetical protein
MSGSNRGQITYQHKDTKYLNELREHLGTLIHRGRIEFFSDREISGGREWNPEIREKLDAAKVIVPLISPHFLGSAYTQTVELPTAMSRQQQGEVVVLPVLLEECDWEGLDGIAKINILPKDESNNLKPLRSWHSKKHAAYTQVARAIRQIVEEV